EGLARGRPGAGRRCGRSARRWGAVRGHTPRRHPGSAAGRHPGSAAGRHPGSAAGRRPGSAAGRTDRRGARAALMGRILFGGMTALLICIFLSPRFIEFLRRREFGQHIRDDGPEGHHIKAGTPTMGGLILFLAVSVPFLILTDYDWRSIGVFGAALACALLGFADDYTKLVRRRSLGLRARTKLGVTIAISLGLWFIAQHEAHLAPTLRLRFVDYEVDLDV